MEIERDIRAVGPAALIKRALVSFLNHIRGASDFLFRLLSPELIPLFFGLVEFVDIIMELFVVDGVVLDFGDHNLVEQINFPELLVVADFFVILGVD
jgi:hypothetical protein